MRSGFTFVEILAALAVLGIVAAAALQTHALALRAEQKARNALALRLLIYAAETRAIAGTNFTASLPAGLVAEEMEEPPDTDKFTLVKWTFKPPDCPAAFELYTLRPAPALSNAAAAAPLGLPK